MSITWNDSVPIYRQLRERVVAMILDGALNEGDPLPSVRQVAADFQINPLTVSKAYQELVDDQLVEKRRGLGMFVIDGAREALLKSERERFLREEWPALYARAKRRRIRGVRHECCRHCQRPEQALQECDRAG
jgi:GntR family transcriptional regulator